jgi:hypothetical protein
VVDLRHESLDALESHADSEASALGELADRIGI